MTAFFPLAEKWMRITLILLIAVALPAPALATDDVRTCREYLAYPEKTRSMLTARFIYTWIKNRDSSEDAGSGLIVMNSAIREMVDRECAGGGIGGPEMTYVVVLTVVVDRIALALAEQGYK